MKKKLSLTIVSLMCLGVFGLTACNPTATTSSIVDATSEVANTVYNSIAIDNKDELMASWKEEEADRELDLTIDPIGNINLLLSTDKLTVTSSDTAVVTATGIKLHAAGAGTTTITVTLVSGESTITDTVEITVEAVAAPISIEAARGIAKGELVKTRGYVTSIVNDLRFATIADGDFAIELYYTADLIGDIKVGDLVQVKGTSSPYNALMEIGTLTEIKKIVASENTDVALPTDLYVTDWDAISDASDSRIVSIMGMVLTTMPTDYVVGDLGDDTANKAKRFDVGLTLDGKAVAMSVDYHNGWEACDAIYNKLASVPLTSTVDFHGLLTSFESKYQLAPMSGDDLVVHTSEITDAEALEMLRTTLTDLDYSEGTYEIKTLPLADTLDNYSVSYEVSTELAALVTVDAATGKVTVTDTAVAVSGTITASIYDADSAMVGEAIVIDVTISAPLVEPEATTGKTLADLTAVESDDYKMVKYSGVTGIVSNLKDDTGSADGNFDVAADAEGNDKFVVYGATATLGSIKFDNHDGDYYFSNPADFLTIDATAAIVAGDEITFNAIRYAYGDTNELSIEITAIGGVDVVIPDPVVPDPVENGVRLTATNLGVTGSYSDNTATVDGVDFAFHMAMLKGGNIQINDSKDSKIWNTSAFTKAIASVSFTAGDDLGDTTGYFVSVGTEVLTTPESEASDTCFSIGDSFTSGETKTIAFTGANTYFALNAVSGYAAYFSSITINYVD